MGSPGRLQRQDCCLSPVITQSVFDATCYPRDQGEVARAQGKHRKFGGSLDKCRAQLPE